MAKCDECGHDPVEYPDYPDGYKRPKNSFGFFEFIICFVFGVIIFVIADLITYYYLWNNNYFAIVIGVVAAIVAMAAMKANLDTN